MIYTTFGGRAKSVLQLYQSLIYEKFWGFCSLKSPTFPKSCLIDWGKVYTNTIQKAKTGDEHASCC